MLADGRTELDNLAEYWADAQKYRSDYYEERELVKQDAYVYDGIRLLVSVIVLSLPFAMSLLAVIGCMFKRGAPAMWMALSFFPLMFLVFLFATIQMPLALFLGLYLLLNCNY